MDINGLVNIQVGCLPFVRRLNHYFLISFMACIPIASQIVKETVPEFSDMSLDDIGKCFLSVDSACIGVDTDTTHTAGRQAIGLSTEEVRV